MKVFSDCCDPAAQPDIFSFSSLASACKCIMYPIREEAERSPTAHSQGTACVIGENENGSVIRRIFAHHPFHVSSGQGPRTGPNMFRPIIHAPMLSKPR